ncbi:MAG: ABC transporter ATP-binding protein [Shimia sp.]|uniref:ABC transporter ATP-binding protein n=1 Tax=Shimia sp. TaxID=1954381 RepID=UPI0040598E0F
MNPSIDVSDLSVFAEQTRLVGPISFTVEQGGTLVIMGETGAGKSLIAQVILGTLPSALRAEGQIWVNGRRVDTMSQVERAAMWGHELATLPQEPWRALNPLMRAFKQVAESYRFVAGLDPNSARKATVDAFDALDLNGAETRLPGTLSGGMAQRVAFAAATAGNALILLADEPTKGLDSARHTKVIDLLTAVPETGGTLVAITHEVSTARKLGGDLIVLRDGEMAEQGKVATVLSSPSSDYTHELLNAAPQSWSKSSPHAAGNVVLQASDLDVTRGNKALISSFNLTLKQGERIALTGPSGIGKTSLLDVLAGRLPPTTGHVERAQGLSRHAVQKLYQDPPAAFPTRIPLEKALRDVARLHGTEWQTMLQTLERLGVHPALLSRRPDEVSGGELQRISIARALSVRPRILLADEPTSRLDPITQRDTLRMLEDISDLENIAVVLVTHDLEIAQKWADRVIALT